MNRGNNSDVIVFISYAREGSEAAKKLYRDLKDAGLTAWLDKESILPGQKWENEIEDKFIKSKRTSLGICR